MTFIMTPIISAGFEAMTQVYQVAEVVWAHGYALLCEKSCAKDVFFKGCLPTTLTLQRAEAQERAAELKKRYKLSFDISASLILF